MKSKLLLLDANVVIEAHRQKLWKALYTRYEISLPSVVLQREVQFFRSKRDFGNEEILLKPLVDAGLLQEVSATSDDIDNLSRRFKASFF
jgi:predicted nucleic acid-binding protein